MDPLPNLLLVDQIRQKIEQHLEKAEQRLPETYREHRRFRYILSRHLRFPKETLLDPVRPILRLIRQSHRLSNKREQWLVQSLSDDWLALPTLMDDLNKLCFQAHPEHLDELNALSQEEQTKLFMAMQQQLQRLFNSRDGVRDVGLIAAIAMGQALSKHSTISGSAFALGASVGSQAYIAHQTGLSWLWINFTGVPTWVTIGAGLGGLVASLMLLPLIGPIAEWCVWRLRGKKIMSDYLTQVRQALLKPKYSGVDAACILAQYAQWLPDGLALLRLRL